MKTATGTWDKELTDAVLDGYEFTIYTPLWLAPRIMLFTGKCEEVLPSVLLPNSLDSIVTDPPYELGFMGKEWDSSGIAFSREMWAECFRVLKPGGHLLSFGGTRTWHRMAVAIEDAGFEIRDSIAWLYGSGFPKSLDVSKAIDKGSGQNRARQLEFTEWMRSTGITSSAINDATGSNMGGHYLTDAAQPRIATADMFDALRHLLPEVPERIERLVAERTGITWTDYVRRPITRHATRPNVPGEVISFDQRGSVERERRDIPATPDAERWQGWGTALKPAFEPIVVARKPFRGTVAANVLAHGTGALNIDGCRIEHGGNIANADGGGQGAGYEAHNKPARIYGKGLGDIVAEPHTSGRWPANVVLSEDQATELGEAARFFYCAKAPTSERPKVDGQAHATVKPLTLMRWLVQLVTPPGGIVGDPFAGSGTTLEAAYLEGFSAVGVELEDIHIPLIRQRLEKAQAAEQTSLFELGGAS